MPTALSTDLYEMTMAAAAFAGARTETATFELSVRTLPPGRGYLIAAGLDPALDWLDTVRFTPPEIDYLRSVPALRGAPAAFFDTCLPRFRFTGDVWAMAEGEPVFANEPLLRVTAPLMAAQIVETALLATMLFQTSVASRAARMVDAAAGRPVLEFGARRAHGAEAGALAARAACIGGAAGTSDVDAGRRFGLPLAGTMAHAWVMSHASETEAFVRFMEVYGPQAVLLIDTYDAPRAVDRIVEAGLAPAGVRIDSGDLLAESRAVRSRLDAGGLPATRIVASGDLDEHRIADLVAGGAPIDVFGVGTALSTSSDAPALGGVYKLVEIERDGAAQPVIKLGRGKGTLPGVKQVWRRANPVRDRIARADEPPPAGARPLLEPVMQGGGRLRPPLAIETIRRRTLQAVRTLPAAARRLERPVAPEVEVSAGLADLRDATRQRLAART